MKSIIKINTVAIALLLFTFSICRGQILKPVKWAYAFKRTSPIEGIIYLKSDIDPGWHIYSLSQPPGGPLKTFIKFNKSNAYSLLGAPTEPKPEEHYEKVFGINVFYFQKSVIFQQRVKLKPGLSQITGKIAFMVCSARQCLEPDDIEFAVPIK